MKIGLVRHGITDWNMEWRAQGRTDVPLNETGIEQAQAVAKRLSTEKWELVVSSDLSRAYETGKTISDMLGIPLIKDTRLQEMGFGKIEGTTEKERVERWGEEWRQLDLGFEPKEEAMSRSLACVEEFCEKHSDKNILFVSHGATLNQLIRGLLRDPEFDQGLNNTSVSVFEKNTIEWRCALLNCAKHLEEQLTK
ncbi:histidine phosphatase family protein [Bacillaceae bacterium S4-13-58]